MIVKIEKLDYFGRGVTRDNNKVCFVKGALPGEKVDIEIVKENKKFNEGKIVKILEESPNRVEVTCPHYKECGGCHLLHLDSAEEDNYKKSKVQELVDRVGFSNKEIVTDVHSYKKTHYRNKVIFHVKDRKLGFYKEKSNEIVEINSCKLLREEINKIIPILKSLVEDSKNDIEEIMVRVGNNNTKDKMIVGMKGKVNNLLNLDEVVDGILINNKSVTQEDKLLTSIGTKKFYVSDKSFFQVNDSVVSKLYDEVLDFCKKNEVKKALDLYCGTGTIGIYISDYVEEVLGIDSAKSSIKDAKENKALNNTNNIKFICSKVEDHIDKIKGKYDLVIVDPPRAGLDNKTIKHLLKIASKNIIYISCDPATLARDLKELNKEYEVLSIKPFNMFPKTYHVECVCVLELK